jgi:hypothetical protein
MNLIRLKNGFVINADNILFFEPVPKDDKELIVTFGPGVTMRLVEADAAEFQAELKRIEQNKTDFSG